jgi:hypothetical protein
MHITHATELLVDVRRFHHDHLLYLWSERCYYALCVPPINPSIAVKQLLYSFTGSRTLQFCYVFNSAFETLNTEVVGTLLKLLIINEN